MVAMEGKHRQQFGGTAHHTTGGDLAYCRRAAGLSQAELGEMIGCGRHAISYWETKAIVPLAHGVPRKLGQLFRADLPHFSMPTARACHGVLSFTAPTNAARTRCNAKTRDGHPCRAKSEPGRARCRLHGGLSTGPKSAEGRERIATAQRQRWQDWRENSRPVATAPEGVSP